METETVKMYEHPEIAKGIKSQAKHWKEKLEELDQERGDYLRVLQSINKLHQDSKMTRHIDGLVEFTFEDQSRLFLDDETGKMALTDKKK